MDFHFFKKSDMLRMKSYVCVQKIVKNFTFLMNLTFLSVPRHAARSRGSFCTKNHPKRIFLGRSNLEITFFCVVCVAVVSLSAFGAFLAGLCRFPGLETNSGT